jgi:hypothetical protein
MPPAVRHVNHQLGPLPTSHHSPHSSQEGGVGHGPAAGERACRICGCTDERACVTDAGPCFWVEVDVCSACVDLADAV